ncbi:MAG: hypothetical protein IAF38_19630 [Bacteroidia bacterium]|nr:hypothetical protein [Bacteroidia bacterium]
MSTQKKLLLLLWNALFFFFTLGLNAQTNDDPVFAFDVKVKAEGKMIHDYNISLSQNGKKTDTVSFKRSKEVYVTLKRNEVYTFTFTKKGYSSKVLIVNTTLPDNVKTVDLFTLYLQVDLLPEEKVTDETKVRTVYANYDGKLDDFALCANHCD